jgi:hypothetical protein
VAFAISLDHDVGKRAANVDGHTRLGPAHERLTPR